MQEVAIKAPKVSTLNSGAIEDFFREAKTAINFKHENILKCLGISFGNTFSSHTEEKEFSFNCKWYSVSEGVQGVPWLIFEFMHYGDLAGILLANSGVKSFNNDRLPTLSKVKILFDIVVSLDN